MRSIGILSHVGNGNLGDEALFAAALQNVRALFPDADVVGLSTNPADSEQRHGIKCFPLRHPYDHAIDAVSEPGRGLRHLLRRGRRALTLPLRAWREARFLVSSFRVVRRLDAVVVSGSGQINEEWGGAWGFPYTLFKWTALARLAGVRFAYLSVGATELHQPLSGWFVGRALRLATYRSYRDAGTKRIVSEFVPADTGPVVPDLAFSLMLPPIDRSAAEGGNRVAINPMALYDGSPWPTTNADVFEGYCAALIEFAAALLRAGYVVELFTSQRRMDLPTAQRIAREVTTRVPDATVPVHTPDTPQDALKTIANFDYVIGTRFHGILFSLLLHKAVVALSYERKARQLMESVGQGDLVIDVAECTYDRLQSAFDRLVAERAARLQQIATTVPRFRERLDEQYREALGLPPTGRRQAQDSPTIAA